MMRRGAVPALTKPPRYICHPAWRSFSRAPSMNEKAPITRTQRLSGKRSAPSKKHISEPARFLPSYVYPRAQTCLPARQRGERWETGYIIPAPPHPPPPKKPPSSILLEHQRSQYHPSPSSVTPPETTKERESSNPTRQTPRPSVRPSDRHEPHRQGNPDQDMYIPAKRKRQRPHLPSSPTLPPQRPSHSRRSRSTRRRTPSHSPA